METLANVPTPLLRIGDIVCDYGMRILLDQPAKIWHSSHDCYHSDSGIVTHDRCRVAYSWLGTVTNVDEVRAAGVVPIGWMRYDSRPGEYVWNVQGNELARWTVERG